MTFDINPMQSTASPIALLVVPQGVAATDYFATLLDREAPVEQVVERGVPTSSMAAVPAPRDLLPAKEAIPAPIEASLAIAKADALVATLAPAPGHIEAPVAAPVAAHVQTALSILARPAARRDPPTSLPKEKPDEDRPNAGKETDDTAPAAPVILALPETQGTQRPATAPSASPEPLDATPAKRAAPPAEMAEMANRARLPDKAEGEARSSVAVTVKVPVPVPAVEPELEKPAKAEAKPVPVKTGSAEKPQRIDLPASTQPQPGFAPKAAPVRASKVAEIAIGLADALPDTIAAMIQKPVPDAPTPAPGPVTPATAAPASPGDMIVDRQLDLVRNEQWLGELAHDIASTSGDNNRLSFRLMPQQLGRLDVDVTRSHNGLSLAIHTESDSAQAILTAAQPRLVDEIRAQGLRLADTQMFSGDARQSPGQDGHSRPATLIETYIPSIETVDLPEPEQRDGRYA